MPILIDGHNLIGKLPGLSLQDPDDEEKLVRLLVAYSARAGKAVTVVFDPGEVSPLWQARRHGGVQVIFVPRGHSADSAILRRVSASRNPREWLVVTSDQALAKQVARLGARVRSAEQMAGDLSSPGGAGDDEENRSRAAPTADEVEAWLAVFLRGKQ